MEYIPLTWYTVGIPHEVMISSYRVPVLGHFRAERRLAFFLDLC